jgi:hypothetical protein
MFTYLQNLYYTLTKNEQALLILKYKKIAALSQKLYETRQKHLKSDRGFLTAEKIRKLIEQINLLTNQVNIEFPKMKLTSTQLEDIDFYIDTISFWNKQSKALAESQKPVYYNDQPV